jgi:hypothetical protein
LVTSSRRCSTRSPPHPTVRARSKRWLEDLHAHVDPGVKVTMPVIAPALAEYADARSMRLVRHATSFAARPRFSG